MSIFKFEVNNQDEKPQKGKREIAVIVKEDPNIKNFNNELVPNSLITVSEIDNDDENLFNNTSSIEWTKKIQKKGFKFQLVPNRNIERQIIYCTGQSGSGKSTFTASYCVQYKRIFPKNKIFVISSLKEDETLDKLLNINKDFFFRIEITPQLIEDKIGAIDFKDCLVIFDDFECLKDKLLRDYMSKVRDEILEVGRRYNTYMICTYHLPTNGHDTRRILNESHAVVYFPKSASCKIKNLLENHLGMNKNFFKWSQRLTSRWICILKGYPNLVLDDKNIYLLNELEDNELSNKKF